MTPQELIEELEEYMDLVPEYFYEESWTDFQYEMEAHCPLDLDYCYGATRGVIVPKDENYVLKLSFDGTAYNTWDADDDCFDLDNGEYFGEDMFIQFFTHAPMKCGFDYCRGESLIYQRAVEQQLGKFFLPIEYCGTLWGKDVYIQPKFDISQDEASNDLDYDDYSEEAVAATKKTCRNSHFHCFNIAWLANVYETYGEDELADLISFIQEYDINDLHDGNIGYRHGMPIISDFASFND